MYRRSRENKRVFTVPLYAVLGNSGQSCAQVPFYTEGTFDDRDGSVPCWSFRGGRSTSALAAAYVEFSTGSAAQGLGSRLTDYGLNFIAQEPLSPTTRHNINIGFYYPRQEHRRGGHPKLSGPGTRVVCRCSTTWAPGWPSATGSTEIFPTVPELT